MMSHPEVRTKGLVREAVESGNRESFKVLHKGDDYRVSVGVRLGTPRPIFFLEVLVYLCPPSSEVQLARLKAKLRLIEELSMRGYFLNCEDGGCVSCEVALSARRLASEKRSVMSMADRILGRAEPDSRGASQQSARLGAFG
jgi:hypothetical protein